jgi:hypothetical protein
MLLLCSDKPSNNASLISNPRVCLFVSCCASAQPGQSRDDDAYLPSPYFRLLPALSSADTPDHKKPVLIYQTPRIVLDNWSSTANMWMLDEGVDSSNYQTQKKNQALSRIKNHEKRGLSFNFPSVNRNPDRTVTRWTLTKSRSSNPGRVEKVFCSSGMRPFSMSLIHSLVS